jgi:hypothetical protein
MTTIKSFKKVPTAKLLFTLIILMLISSVTANANTVTDSVPPSLTESIRTRLNNKFGNLTAADTAIIYFQNGTYIIDGTIPIKKPDNTSNFSDDCFLRITGTPKAPISVNISNIKLQLQTHSGIWWLDRSEEKLLIKVYHAKKFIYNNVINECANAVITNLDLRVCSNVTIKNSTFTNYNNCYAGANLSIRGDTHNVNIDSCVFNKYGNDEMLTFFGQSKNALLVDSISTGNVYKDNISVTNNTFNYKNGGNCGEEIPMDVLFTLNPFNPNSSVKAHNVVKDITISYNKFNIEKPIHCIAGFSFDQTVTHSGVEFSNNTIDYTTTAGAVNSFRNDISVNDSSYSRNPIVITHNTTNIHCQVTKGNFSNWWHLSVDGANVIFSDNKVTDDSTINSSLIQGYGGNILITGHHKGGSVTMSGNVIKGLYTLAEFNGSYDGNGLTIPHFTINANDNSFDGDTHIYCYEIDQLDLNFTNNNFTSRSAAFFLDEFAEKGSVIFNKNNVNVTNGTGALLVNWTGADLSKSSVNELQVTDNVFKNVSSSDLISNFNSFIYKNDVENHSNTFQ